MLSRSIKEAENSKTSKIYTINADDYLMYSVAKSCFKLRDDEVYNSILADFELLQKRLSLKSIPYEKLKGALVPNQDKGKFETCFIFDSSQIENGNYGQYIFRIILSVLDKDCTCSILHGDYIDVVNRGRDSQVWLRQILYDVMYSCYDSKYCYSGQYYFIYVNRLTANQKRVIIEELQKYPWFTGYANLDHNSIFKTYIARILNNLCLKYRRHIIIPHPADYSDEENIDVFGFLSEDNKFSITSINEDSFNAFLSYKIEKQMPDPDDIGFSFNALFPKFNSFKKLSLVIKDEKWGYIANEDKGKGKILEALV